MLMTFSLTYSVSLLITILVVFLTSDDKENPFTQFGTKGMLLRCAGFEFVPAVGALIGFAILAGSSGSIVGMLFGPFVALGLSFSIMSWAAMAFFERDFSDSLILVIVLIIANIGVYYGIPHLLGI